MQTIKQGIMNIMPIKQSEASKSKRLPILDSLKGLSAIIIACLYHPQTIGFVHTAGVAPIENRFFRLFYDYGFLFVEFFLLISGYLSFYIYGRNREKAAVSFTTYNKKRLVRILPLIIVTLFTSTVLNLVFAKHNGGGFFWPNGNDTILTLTLELFGLQSAFPIGQSWNYPAWSMSVFILIWIIFWFVIHFTNRSGDEEVDCGIPKTDRNRIIICIALVTLGCSLQLSQYPMQTLLLNGSLARGYLAFFMGGIVYYIQKYCTNSFCRVISEIGMLWTVLCFLLAYGVFTNPEIQWGQVNVLFGLFFFPSLLLFCLSHPFMNAINVGGGTSIPW